MDFGQEGIVKLNDFYGQNLRVMAVQPLTPLEQNPPRTYYSFNGVFFAICEGEGALHYRDYPNALNFENLDPLELEAFLLHKRLSPDQKQRTLIAQFISVYERNIQKGRLYLNPPYFQDAERALFYDKSI